MDRKRVHIHIVVFVNDCKYSSKSKRNVMKYNNNPQNLEENIKNQIYIKICSGSLKKDNLGRHTFHKVNRSNI